MKKAAGRDLQYITVAAETDMEDRPSAVMAQHRWTSDWKGKHAHWMTSKPFQNRFAKLCEVEEIKTEFKTVYFETSGTRDQVRGGTQFSSENIGAADIFDVEGYTVHYC